jgi:hypothetical protein
MRYLKPEFWTDSAVVGMSPWGRLLFIGSWNFAICEAGHLDDDALALKLKVLPADPINAIEVLEEVIASGRIVREQTPDGRSYLRIRNLGKHQKVDARWATRCPYCATSTLANPQESFGEGGRGSTTHANSHLDSAQEGIGGERREKNPSPPDGGDEVGQEGLLLVASEGRPTRKPGFDDFWAIYPRRVGKIAAKAAWDKATKTRKVDSAVILAAAQRYRDDPNLPEETLRPYPQKWLNEGRWEDDPLAAPLDLGRRTEPSAVRPDGSIDADAVLGAEKWSLPSPPPGIEPGTSGYSAWARQAWNEHRAEREAKAREVLARRSA